MKICSKCKVNKPKDEFGTRHNRPSGTTSSCKACIAAYDAKRWEMNKDRLAALNKEWRTKNADDVRNQIYEWRKKNPEAYHAINARSRAKHIARVMVSNGERRAVERRATPAWANKKVMKTFYETARGLNMLLGEWHHVDHIVPLRHSRVCGLHVEHNMQIIPAEENHFKNNRFWPGMPESEAQE